MNKFLTQFIRTKKFGLSTEQPRHFALKMLAESAEDRKKRCVSSTFGNAKGAIA